MLNNWDEGDFQQALLNYEHMLKERPGDAELLKIYQIISLEYEKYKKKKCYKKGGYGMAKAVSQRLKAMQADIEEHFTRQQGQFYLGKLYGQLDEIIKDAEEQEKAYSAMCQLYLVHKPKVLDKAIETMSDILSGKNLKED